MSMIRTFIAIHLTPEILAELRRTQEALRATTGGPAGRWVSPANLHLTVKFLGDVDGARLPEIYATVDTVADNYGPLTLTLSELGCFPHERQPRIVWAGITEPSGQLQRLAEQLDLALSSLGYARESRPFRPHLTLARVNERAPRDQVAALGQAAMSYQLEPRTMVARAVAVVRSDLRPQGPLYTDLHLAALSGATPH
ncbi:MAG: RNA 2',3'-cyclic phosphodiesterase [Anaerolineales bacterium]